MTYVLIGREIISSYLITFILAFEIEEISSFYNTLLDPWSIHVIYEAKCNYNSPLLILPQQKFCTLK